MSTTPSGPVDLSPDHTHLRLSLSKTVVIAAALVGGAFAAAGAWGAQAYALKAHVEDPDVHLEKKFREQHGAPMGFWDLKAANDQHAAAFAALQAQVKALQDARDEDKATVEARKPRWRP